MNKEKCLDIVLNYLCDESGVENTANTLHEKMDLWRELVNKRGPIDIPEDILTEEDKFLRMKLFNKKLTNGEELKSVNELMDISIPHGDKICLWKGDITSIYCDAIVNSASSDLLGCDIPNHECIDNVIHTQSGMRLKKKCNIIMNGNKLNVSEVMITRAYNLLCDFIIHVVSPEVKDKLDNKEKKQLKESYLNIMECAKNNLIKTLVITSLSTGCGRFPKDEACKIAVDTVIEYLDTNDKYFSEVIFDVYTDDDFDIYEDYLRQIKNID